MMQKAEKILKPWHMGNHLRVLSKSYPKTTNTTGFRWSSKILHPCALDKHLILQVDVTCIMLVRAKKWSKELEFHAWQGNVKKKK